MESFFRYISYVDYYKNGEKIRNVGFLRWKLSNKEHRIEIQLKDVPGNGGKLELQEKNTGKKMGQINLDKGIGSYIAKFQSLSASGEMYIDTMDGRLYISEVEGFRIPVREKEYLLTLVDLGLEKKRNFPMEEKRTEEMDTGLSLPEVSYEEKSLSYEKEETGNDTEKENEVKAASENVLFDGIEEKYENPWEERKIELIEPIHEDKWQQLCRKFSHVHPFLDQQTFLSVKPEDFIVLQQGYQKLAQNSFLLHGFYNYGHLILGKLSEDADAPVYLGVPGVYYEREKQAAQMFGFVGFESTEQPVQAGSYGYYMIEVKL